MEHFNDGITKKKSGTEIMKELVQLSDEDHFENDLTLKGIELGEKLRLLKDDVHQLYLQNHKVKQIDFKQLPVFRVAVTTSTSINTFMYTMQKSIK